MITITTKEKEEWKKLRTSHEKISYLAYILGLEDRENLIKDKSGFFESMKSEEKIIKEIKK